MSFYFCLLAHFTKLYWQNLDEERRRIRAYAREFKLSVVNWFRENGSNFSQTSRGFNIDCKRIREWVKNKESIKKLRNHARKNKSKQPGRFALAETKLLEKIRNMRKSGKAVKALWMKASAKQLVKSEYPLAEFKCSDHWLRRFLKRNRLSLRTKTHTAQRLPNDVTNEVLNFHKRLIKVRRRGVYLLSDIANKGQIPLPFILDDGKIYNETNEKDVICKTGASGLDKRQYTAQLTVFADGVPRVKPLLIFRGKGLRITKKERDAWDKSVSVEFQPLRAQHEKCAKISKEISRKMEGARTFIRAKINFCILFVFRLVYNAKYQL